MAAAPQRREIQPAFAARTDRIRARYRRLYDALLEAAPDPTEDPAGYIAAVFGLRDDPRMHWAERCRQAVNIGRDAGMTWREIAVASEGDPLAEGRCQSKQQWRNEAHADFVAGVGEHQLPESGGMPGV